MTYTFEAILTILAVLVHLSRDNYHLASSKQNMRCAGTNRMPLNRLADTLNGRRDSRSSRTRKASLGTRLRAAPRISSNSICGR